MKKANKTWSIVLFILVCLGAVVMIYPLLWMVASSFKPEFLIFRNKSLIIQEFTVAHYVRGWRGVGGTGFLGYMANTLKIVIPVVTGTLISCSMVGFAVARLRFPFKKLVYVFIFLTMMLPFHSTLIPRYIMFRNFGWVGTFLPLSVPAFLTSALFSFIWTYDDFFSQLIYISNPTAFTVSLALRQYIEAFELSAFGVLFAMSTLSLIPIFVLFISFQKYLVEGIATTGMKG